ncbi:MAG: MATE family efflux transporter [Clostridia bacterium]|nr:MATE family efflux transporter [Clostridia bacterium]
MTKSKSKRDLTEGPLFVPMIQFVIPIILTGMLQIFYNMADNIVVGQFSGDELALAAVGSTSSLSNLIVNLLMGIAGGSGVVIAQSYGARELDKLSRAVHTSVVFSFLGGIGFCILGLLISSPALTLMGTKPELMSRALLYMRIICAGIPAMSVYNFGAAALRSVGDSKTPLFILSLSGLMNVLLNLFLVIVCNMSVAGVALATIASQYISAIAVITILLKRKGKPYTLNPRELKIDPQLLKKILALGLPAGFQGTLFSISNIILTAGINTLPTSDISGKTIAINIEGLVHTSMNSYLHSAMTFTGQNYGARKPDRIKKSIIYAVIQVTVIGIVGGQLLNLFGEPLAKLYIDAADPNKEAVLSAALELMSFMLAVYFMCGIMDTLSGALRGLGYSTIPMIVSIGAICVLRAIWVTFVFPTEKFNSLIGIYTIYPISWFLGLSALAISLLILFKRVKARLSEEQDDAPIEADAEEEVVE